jgi:hypothetical protein
LIHWYEEDRDELFRLSDDLGETNDLAAKEPQQVKRLREELEAWQQEVGAKLPIPNPNYDDSKPSGRAAKRNPG